MKQAMKPTAKRPVPAKPVARKSAIGRRKAEPKMPQMKEVEVLLFTSELADLLEAGMTLGQALSCLANQGEEKSAQRIICRDL